MKITIYSLQMSIIFFAVNSNTMIVSNLVKTEKLCLVLVVFMKPSKLCKCVIAIWMIYNFFHF